VSESRWVPLPQAARRLGRHRASVIAFIREGYLIAKLVAGRWWWIREDSLERLRRRVAA